MALRTLMTISTLVLLTVSGTAHAAGPFGAECTINADKSRMDVMAKNLTDKSYACLVSCKLNVAGQRAFDAFQCQFSLPANTQEKSVCNRKGSGPGHFTKKRPTKLTCVPR